MAAARWIDCVGNIAPQQNAPDIIVRIGNGHGRNQGLGIGMLGVVEQFVRGCHFHNPSEIHDRHPVADMFDHRQIVGDKQIGEIIFLLQIF